MSKPVKKVVGKMAKKAYDHAPEPVKEKVKDTIKTKAKETFVNSVEGGIQSKAGEASKKLEQAKEKNAANVHTKAEEAKEKVQDVLLSVREKLGNAKEAGEEFQKKVSSSNDKKTKMKGVGNIKGASDIKSSFNIKSSTEIKSSKDIKTICS